MRKYRYYNNIKWGKRFNPETLAHHCDAEDYDSLRKDIPQSTGAQSIEVHTAQGWQWITSVPVHLGGIAKHWHGERI